MDLVRTVTFSSHKSHFMLRRVGALFKTKQQILLRCFYIFKDVLMPAFWLQSKRSEHDFTQSSLFPWIILLCKFTGSPWLQYKCHTWHKQALSSCLKVKTHPVDEEKNNDGHCAHTVCQKWLKCPNFISWLHCWNIYETSVSFPVLTVFFSFALTQFLDENYLSSNLWTISLLFIRIFHSFKQIA